MQDVDGKEAEAVADRGDAAALAAQHALRRRDRRAHPTCHRPPGPRRPGPGNAPNPGRGRRRRVSGEGPRHRGPQGNVLCGADIAVVLLDRPVDGVAPSAGARRGRGDGRAGAHGRLRPARSRVGLGGRHPRGPGQAAPRARARGRHDAHGVPRARGPLPGQLQRPCTRRGHRRCPSAWCFSRRSGVRQGADAYDVYTRADAFASLIEGGLSQSASAGKGASHTVNLATDIRGPLQARQRLRHGRLRRRGKPGVLLPRVRWAGQVPYRLHLQGHRGRLLRVRGRFVDSPTGRSPSGVASARGRGHSRPAKRTRLV